MVWTSGPGAAKPLTLKPLSAEAAAARVALLAIAANTFRFLEEERRFAGGVAWHAPDASHLWRYHLHYFGYVRELMLADAEGGDCGAAEFQRLAASWIASNRAVRGDGWHPYTLSLRIVNWLKARGFWAERFTEATEWQRAFDASVHDQAHHLLLQLEHDVRGNHLFENGRALVWVGLMTRGDNATRWRDRGLRILEQEVPVQILADGCHFERCPGYHFSVLSSLVEIGCLFELQGVPPPTWLQDAIRRMHTFGAAILLPDGTYPLLKDSAQDQVPGGPGSVLDCANRWLDGFAGDATRKPALRTMLYFGRAESGKPDPSPAIPATSSGYCIGRATGEAVVFDAGQPCPSYLPAHAHADALSFVFHASGLPLVVDAGVFEYTAGPWRDYFRSTAAHNTVSIERENSSDVWGSFRVGRKARVRLLQHEVYPGALTAVAEHDGFAHLAGRPGHRRLLGWRAGHWLAVLDVITGDSEAEVTSRLHFHPRITPGEADRTAYGWRSTLNPCGWHLLTLGETAPVAFRGQIEPFAAGWYSERFGRREAATVMTWTQRGPMPRVMGYVLTVDPRLVPRVEATSTGWNIVLESNLAHDTYSLSRPGVP